MLITNKNKLPEPVYQAIVNDTYQQHGDISVTGLESPVRQRQLKLRYSNQISEDASDRIFSLFGQLIHSMIERSGDVENGFVEERLSVDINGWKVTGQSDLFMPPVLSDYKVTSLYAVMDGVKPEWERQLNSYAYLWTRAGYKVEKLQIVALLRDWSKTRAIQRGYPSQQVKVLPVSLWDSERAFRYINERVKAHQEGDRLPGSDLPYCTDSEIWAKPTRYALMKEGQKRAVKLYDSLEDMKKALNGKSGKHYGEERPGQRTRCEYYCPVKEVCAQYKGE